MAAGDIYKASEAQTNASQREALAALARGGTAERDAYMAAQEAAKGDQQRIMQEILARSTALGAPAAGDEMQAKAQPGFDRRSFALAGSQGSAQSALDQIAAANKGYFDEVNAAVPIVKARSDEINEANRLKAEQAEADRQLQLAIKDMALAEAQARLGNTIESGRNAAAKASAGGDLSDSELRTRLAGAGEARQAAIPAPLKNLSVFGVKIPAPSQQTLARQAGIEAGFDPARVLGLTQPKPAKAPAAPKQAAHRASVLTRVQQHASAGTVDAVTRTVAAARSLAEALTLIADTPDDQLRKNGVSRDKLKAWVRDYYAV